MDNMVRGNAIVGQSGGPTAVINASLSGVIRAAYNNYDYIKRLYGTRFGIDGLIKDDVVELKKMTDEEHYLLESTPASVLGSCRIKLPDPNGEDVALYEKIFTTFAKYSIRYFYLIGGNDTMDSLNKISVYAKRIHYQLKCVGVPKTIDNDLVNTDHCPGFGTAAKFVATTMQEVARDCSVYDIKSVTIVEIMGRDAGWLTAAAGLPRLYGEKTADLIYLPEVAFSVDKFIDDVQNILKKKNTVLVAVSEGIRNENGEYISSAAGNCLVDNFGHKSMSGTAKTLETIVKSRIGCKARGIEISLLQRCSAHLHSKTDVEEAIKAGKTAVDVSVSEDFSDGRMIIFERIKGCANYQIKMKAVPVLNIANEVSNVPLKYITEDRNNVSDELLELILPLIQGERAPVIEDGLPVYYTI